MMITATARPNKFAGKCAGCQGAVLANEGQLTGSTGSWTVRHLPGECSTAAPAPVKTGPEVKTMGVFRAPAGGLWVARPSRGPDKTRLVAFALVPGADETFDLIYKRGAIYDLREAWRMSYAEAHDIAVKLGQCIVCGHRFGKDDTSKSTIKSRAEGIGPKCRAAFPDYALYKPEADLLAL